MDDYPVAGKANVTRVYHPFTKHAGNPVLPPTEPWEENITYIYGTVMPNETRTGYRMWYHTMRPNDTSNDGSNILYAESTNGINWTKPILNIRSWHGSTANNMIFVRPGQSGITSVMHTPWDPDLNRKYRLMNYEASGYWGAYSNNGVHTFDLPNNPVLTGVGDVAQFMFDPHTSLYRGYVKLNSTVNGLQRRSVGLTDTTEINSWPTARLILEVDSHDDRWVPPGTVQRTHLYGLSVFAYESMYMGFLWIFRATDVDGYYIGPVYTEIVSSHDGARWIREEGTRPAMLPLGPEGAWDDGQLYTAKAPIIVGNELWVYYGACDDVHGTATKKLNCAIGLARLRKDGFASLDASSAAGNVTTRRLAGASGPLRVNYKATGGLLRAEVLDGLGNVVPGYSLAECNPLTGDSVDQIVTWTARAELPGGLDSISLRFVIQNASVYSFMAGEAVTIIAGPTITRQPTSRTVAAGATATFAVAATGDPPITYQWQKEGVNLTNGGHYSGATTNTLAISNAASADAGSYRCVVTNPGGSATSDTAILTVDTNVPISFHETWDTYIVGQTDPAYLARWASIAGITRYAVQAWDEVSPPNTLKVTKDIALGVSHPLATELGAAIPGATEVGGTDANPLALLYQTWLNTAGSHASADVFVELSKGDLRAPTGNSATTLPVLAFGLTAGLHGSASFPRFFDGRNWNPVTTISTTNRWNYFYLAIRDSTVYLEGRQSASGSATLPRLYTGGFDRLTIRTGLNTVQWRALGDLSLTGGVVAPPPAPPTITQHPVAQSVCLGRTAQFTVSAAGSVPLAYQWQKDNVNLTNGGRYAGVITSTLTVSNTDAGDVADYRCVVSNANGSATSSAAALSLKPTCRADFDRDCDVDEYDFSAFDACISGPQVPFSLGCELKNFDGDLDVDSADFGFFQRCLTGSNNPINPDCTQ
ncbi:MAG TPA: immunoglobulin domain-containing protein [Phycisphaerae bacterium]|nr:immunoglobulin domain-containing protein [Phycisphaerae bacterium]